MSRSSSRCLILMTDSKLEKRVSSLSGSQTHHTISNLSSSFNLQYLSTSGRNYISNFYSKRSETTYEQIDQLKQALKKKQQMRRFYEKQVTRRKIRFQQQISQRQNILNQTINNLTNLIRLQVDKNNQLQEQIDGFKVESRKIESKTLPFQQCADMGIFSEEQTMLLNETPVTLAEYI